jgi:hypothetical protein
MSDRIRSVERAARDILQPDEHVLAATRATIDTPALAVGGGLLLLLAFLAEARSKARGTGIGVAIHMTLALTDGRLLVLRRGTRIRRRRLLGAVPLDLITDVRVRRHGFRTMAAFRLADRPALEFVVYRGDHPERLSEAFERIKVPSQEPLVASAPPAIPPPPPAWID